MTGWITATATAAVLGVAGVGALLGQGPYAQTVQWIQDGDKNKQESFEWAFEPEQVVRSLKLGSGTHIGVSIRDLEDADVKTAKGTTSGVVIDEVTADSPAQKAGFLAGDIVVEFDGERVRSARQFARLVQETPADRQVQAAVMRAGQRVTLSVQPRDDNAVFYQAFKGLTGITPKVGPFVDLQREFPQKFGLLGATGRLGITVDELSPQLADYFGTKEGVLVRSVNDNSPASKAGIKAGDIITSVDGNAVRSVSDLRLRTQGVEYGNEFSIGIVRDKKPLTLKGKLERPAQARTRLRTVI